MLIERDQPSLLEGAAIIAASLLLAVALHRLVEAPLRRLTGDWKIWRNLILVGVCVGLVVGSVDVWRQVIRADAARAEAQAIAQHPGARVLDRGYRPESAPTEPVVPGIAEIPYQWALNGIPCPADWGLAAKAQQQCQVLTDPSLDAAAAPAGEVADDLPLRAEGLTRVLLIGNSHMQMWSTALRQWGADNGWQVVMIYEQSCYLAPAGDPINTEEKCAEFWPDVFDSIEPLDPQYVFTVGTRSEFDGETVLDAGLTVLSEHARPGRTIVALRDTPRFEEGLVQCDAAREPDDPPCESGHPILETPNPLTAFVAGIKGMTTADLRDLVCQPQLCVPTIGNVRVWMDQHHLTRAYVETTTELVVARVTQAIERA